MDELSAGGEGNPFARTQQLLGRTAIEALKNCRVAVFGLGAVGSFATEALARSGVGSLKLVDFDRVDASNINRQLYALNSTMGREKAQIARDRIKDINPLCQVESHSTFVNSDSLVSLLSDDLDMVVDAIDGLNSKVNLIFGAKTMGLNLVSSMGAAGRVDISMIRTGDLFESSVCPLARMVRQRLRRRGLSHGVPCVYSVEPPLNKQPFNPEDAGEAMADHGRPRPPLGTIAWVPGCFGLALAGQAVEMIIS
ncbi:MAG: tRNA threonylcarbamoyladenosine dehydratase [Desulfobacter sp.]|nr:tRNA threonylcarbamoyladenosine dehydratase [Desulfobacter sp.]WDP85131.1 MAG: tRNA threonylcarbamoyladenosine dehydratase [Desulfobacter sp.]